MSKDMVQRILKTCRRDNLFSAEDRLLIACSGGPDSVSLLSLLVEISRVIPLELGVASMDHQLRPNSKEEIRLVKELCKRWSIPFFPFSEAVADYAKSYKQSVETAARNLRYKGLRDIAKREEYTYIVLGHHKDDQAETILAHILRGSGLSGLVGMKTKEGDLIRPLLEISKDELKAYADEKGLPYAIDESNMDTAYRRNKLRLHTLPMLEEINPNIKDTLCRLGKMVWMDESYLQELAEDAFKKTVIHQSKEAIVLDKRRYLRYPKPLQYRILRKAIHYCLGFGRFPTMAQIEEVEKLFNANGERRITLQGVHIHIQYDTIKVSLKKEVPETASKETVKFLVWTKEKWPVKDEYAVVIPTEWWSKDLVVRHRNKGDIIFFYSKEKEIVGKKKLKDFLIDKKIPRSQREALWWLCSTDKVFCEIRENKPVSFVKDIGQDCMVGRFKEDYDNA